MLISWYLLKPLFENPHLLAAAEQGALSDQKSRCVNMLRDLELDFATSKLTEEEYRRMKGELSYELADIINKMELSGERT